MEQPRRFTSTPLGPRDRGFELGERHREDVRRTVAAYRALWERYATRPFDPDAWGERAAASIADLAPIAAAEINGLAEGAGLPVRDIAGLNARTELLARANPAAVVTECSAVAVVRPGYRPVAVQTWDWYAAMAGNWLHWTIPHPDGRRVETVTEYGVLGKIGANAAGLGVLLTMLHHRDDDNDDLGLPVHLLSRRVLDEATSVEQALRLVAAAPVSASTSLTLIDADTAVSVELFPGGHGYLAPHQGVITRTNHFVSDVGAPGCLAAASTPSTVLRRTTLLDRFAMRPPATADDVLAAMDHHDVAGGVCRHPQPDLDPLLRSSTLATVVIDPVAGTLDVRPGGPCGADIAVRHDERAAQVRA